MRPIMYRMRRLSALQTLANASKQLYLPPCLLEAAPVTAALRTAATVLATHQHVQGCGTHSARKYFGCANLDTSRDAGCPIHHTTNGRRFSAVPEPAETFAPEREGVGNTQRARLRHLRNIGISAHIDSGKTTLTERILFYTGRINAIHEVRGKDGVGAKMDSMELEREKGITIQSAATFCKWKNIDINIIDTPGHVDFTIEVERALRVLDGAILVLCAVGGVQSQSITVDRQMRRYNVPRLAFINKMDRAGADADRVIGQLQEKLRLNCAFVQVAIGGEDKLQGLVDLVDRQAYHFMGPSGEHVTPVDFPADLGALVEARRAELVEKIAEVDDVPGGVGELFLMEEEVSPEALRAAIRRATIALNFVPVFVGSAYKNKGVQLLLDGVDSYLPSPLDVQSQALDASKNEEPVQLTPSTEAPLVALAFKLEEGKFGQLTYMRIYQGSLARGNTILNVASGKRIKVPRLVRMHSNELQDIQSASAGDIVAFFGVDCASGDSFTDGTVKYTLTSMNVPDPVMSLALMPKVQSGTGNFSKALNRFQKEDPTFRVTVDGESGHTLIAGMGELHLDIYVERMKREYGVDVDVGRPRVSYREAVTKRSTFDYMHRKQSGGQGQFGRVAGFIEPLPPNPDGSLAKGFEFENQIVGSAIPAAFIPSVEKGFREASASGAIVGYPCEGVRVVLTDGASHAVDSSELAFKLASVYAFREAIQGAGAVVLEPLMAVSVTVPTEFQGAAMGDLNKRRGIIQSNEAEADDAILGAHVPLGEMFGYSTALRSMTQGKGEFSMEYQQHAPVTADIQAKLAADHKSTARN